MEIELALVLSSIISGIVEWTAGKTLDLAPPALERAQKALNLVEITELSAVEQAVRKAVETARAEMVSNLGGSMAEGVAQEMIAWLNSPSFAREVALKMVYRGDVDAGRLRKAYIDLDPARNSPRWQALGSYIEEFIDAIQGHLRADQIVGPMLRHAQIHASSMAIEEHTKSSAASSNLTAQNTSQLKLDLQSLLQQSGQQTIYMAQTPNLIENLLQRLERPMLVSVITLPKPILSHAEESYLRLLRKECNQLPLAKEARSIHVKQSAQAELSRVYVDLQTQTPASLQTVFNRLGVPQHERPALERKLYKNVDNNREPKLGLEATSETAKFASLTPNSEDEFKKHPLRKWAKDKAGLKQAVQDLNALEVVHNNRHLVLLGDPGSGKSTFVNHLAFTFAGALLHQEPDWQTTLQSLFDTPLFTIRVILRRWAAKLPANAEPGIELVYTLLESVLGYRSRADLEQRLASEETLLLFDGLDEVPTPDDPGTNEEFDRRRIVVASVDAFCTAHPRCHIVVTSRINPYRRSEYQLAGLPVYTLAPLDTERVNRFTHRWYEELNRVGQVADNELNDVRGRLLLAIEQRAELRKMAVTPLLLTMLARVNARNRLPDSRAELYRDCVEQLLWEWEETKIAETSGQMQSLGSLLTASGANLKAIDVERILWEMTYHAHQQSGKDRTAELQVEELYKRLTRLHPRKHESRAWASQMVELIKERSGLLIAIEEEVLTFPHRTFQEYLAARWLLEQNDYAQLAAEKATSDIWQEVVLLACGYLAALGQYNRVQPIIFELMSGASDPPELWSRLLVAGQAWLEFGPQRAIGAIGTAIKHDLPISLTHLMQNSKATAAQRLEAGLIAADLDILPDHLDQWVKIDSSKQLGYNLKLAKYPLTNHQFAQFMAEGGYDRSKSWWKCRPEAIAELKKFWTNWPQSPHSWNNSTWNKATQPVVGISWYEACAYCDWLNQNKHRFGIATAEFARLPAEQEWQFATAGADDLTYPWGNDFSKENLNSKESDLQQTSPVYMYPVS